MKSLREAVMEYAALAAEGTPLVAKEFLHLGSRAAVDQALSRLARSGNLLRVGRGLYVRPVEGRFGVRPPGAGAIVQAIVAQGGETVVPHGAAAANGLGLTTQVPVREVYLTSGPTRRLQLEKQVVELRHAPAWQLAHPGSKAGALIRALAWLGPERASGALDAVREKLSEEERNAVMATRRMLPAWMARQVGRLVPHA